MSTIPASAFVNVVPSVIQAGGNNLNLVALILSEDTRVPIGTVQSFPNALAVANFFGASSKKAQMASNYFNGYQGATATPGALLFTQYNQTAVAAYNRGGSVAALTLAQLQALNGTLQILIDGVNRNGGVINLGAATSFSSAAGIIQTALGTATPTLANGTGSIAGNVLTVATLGSGLIQPGQTVNGTGVQAGTYIQQQLSGSVGGTGTYQVNNSQTALSEALTFTPTAPTVAFDSISGGFVITSGIVGVISSIGFGTGTLATSLNLTQLNGAVLSQGAAAATPATFMNSVVQITQNWATFTSSFDPDNGVGNTQKLAFAQWTSGQNNRYMYVPWDTDPNPAAQAPATGSLGYLVGAAGFNYSGIFPVYEPTTGGLIAAFVCGIAASINFNATNGRTAFAYRQQAGLVAGVTTLTAMNNLIANGYNFYGAVGTANQNFAYLYNGQVSGQFAWADSFLNQIWLNNAFQLALIIFLQNVASIPYNRAGNAQIEAALAATIQQGLTFGAYRTGVALSAAQISEVNTQAGANIAGTLQQQGWYLQVLTASASVRVARQSPPCTFFYVDGQSIQQINLASIEVQ